MAFEVHCNRCTLTPSQCDDLIADWRACAEGRPGDVRRRALAALERVTPAGLGMLGFTGRGRPREWLQSPAMPAGLALSLILLDRMAPLTPLTPATWHQLYHHGERLGLPPRLARMIAHGPRLARWLAAFARTPPPPREPVDAHIGGWVPARTALRLLPHLEPEGADPAHDAIRALLFQLQGDDWLVISVDA